MRDGFSLQAANLQLLPSNRLTTSRTRGISMSTALSMRTLLISAFSFALFPISAVAQDAPPAPPNAVVQGTIALIQLTDRIDTRTVKPGDHFHARLAEPLTAEDGEVLPEGEKIKGHVSAVQPGCRPRVLVSLVQIDTPRGWGPLMATVDGDAGEHGMRTVGEEGDIGGKVVAGGAAAEGERAAGKKGAAQGAGAGAADAAYSA